MTMCLAGGERRTRTNTRIEVLHLDGEGFLCRQNGALAVPLKRPAEVKIYAGERLKNTDGYNAVVFGVRWMEDEKGKYVPAILLKIVS